ncbi:hypothetical protein [uncultured Sphingomonas sp.]|uniref:hypothetical protein n=1 Tax=uncultured Sphingomonas sp. TaxID=158754 RepID=UPI0035CABD87
MFAPLALLLILAAPAPADQHRDDQWRAFEQRRDGRLLPLREIESRVVPTMRGAEYIGFDFDGGSGVYTLKFLRNGTVIWVAVDGHSGQVLGRTRG